MTMDDGKPLLRLLVLLCVFILSLGAPIPNYDIFPHFQLHVLSGPFIIFLSVAILLAFGILVLGCTCCVRKDVQGLRNQPNQQVVGQQDNNLSALQNGSEFAIFPPCSTAINLQPVHSSSLFDNEAEKVFFEPLPDILPKRHINGQNFAQSSKPAHFSLLLKRKSSLNDWFDDPNSNFPRNQLQYLQEIGNGWFGRVVEGEAQMIIDGQEKTPVIVKILREEATPSEHLYFLHDVRPYRELHHPNILHLLGRCLETDPFLLILEHSNLNLKTYLTNRRESGTKPDAALNEKLLQFICEVTSGLSHMHQHNFTHSDLAARNCFIGLDDVVKIGDYGLSQDMFREDYYCVGESALPIRWLAPEILECSERFVKTGDVTKESNVWSLGVLFWEILELGQMPYSELTNEEVLQKVVLEGSVRLKEPVLAHPYRTQMHQIMELCWRLTNFRPDVNVLEMLLKQLSQHKESSESFSLFEQRWDALQCKASLPSNVLKFENDFVSSCKQNSSLFGESISDSSCEPFHENTDSYRSPSLRALNGSFDELQVEDETTSSNPHLQDIASDKGTNGMEVVTPEQITEAIRDFDEMLASEALMLGVDSRSATLERPMHSKCKRNSSFGDSDRITDMTSHQHRALTESDSEVTSDPISNVFMSAQMQTLPDIGEGAFENEAFDSHSDEHVPYPPTQISPAPYPSDHIVNFNHVHDVVINGNVPKFSPSQLPDIVITQQSFSRCDSSDDAQDVDCSPSVVEKPVKKVYHFVMRSDSESNSEPFEDSKEEVSPPDVIEPLASFLEDRSHSSCPVTSTPSKSSEFCSVFNSDSFEEEKIFSSEDSSQPFFTEGSTDSKGSKLSENSLNNTLSDADNTVSFKTAPTYLDEDNNPCNNESGNSADEVSGVVAMKNTQATDENLTSLSENSFFSAVSNIKTDIFSKDHSHSEDYYSTLENSPALSEKTISVGVDNQRSETPDSFSSENLPVSEGLVCQDIENNYPSEEGGDVNANVLDSVHESYLLDVTAVLPPERIICDSEMPPVEREDDIVDEAFVDNVAYNEVKGLPEHLSNQSSEQTAKLNDNCLVKNNFNAPPDFHEDAKRLISNSNEIENCHSIPDLVNHINPTVTSSFMYYKPYMDLQEDPELEMSPKTSDGCTLDNDLESKQDIQLNGNDDKFGRIIAWNDHNKIIVSDLSDIDEVESENSSSEHQKPVTSNCVEDLGLSLFTSANNFGDSKLSDFGNHRVMPLPCEEEYDDGVEEEEDQIEPDEVLKIDIETNEAILVDRSESLIGFVPSRSIELLQECDCIASQLKSAEAMQHSFMNGSDLSDDEALDISMRLCNGNPGEGAASNFLSPYSDNFVSSDDEAPESDCDKLAGFVNGEYEEFSAPNESKSDLSQSPASEGGSDVDQQPIIQNASIKNNIGNYKLSDLYGDMILGNQPTKSIIWNSDDTLDVLKDDENNIGSVIIESEEILAGFHSKNHYELDNLNGDLKSSMQFGSSDFLDRLAVSGSPSPNCSAASTPCRDVVYTPDFESESDESTSSCSSTSGSFECIHNKFKHVTDISMESVKKEDSPDSENAQEKSPLKVFSKTWDCHATPNKGLLKSPEKKMLPIRKSVSFHEDPQLVFQYPPASDSSDDDGGDNNFLRRIDYTSYADWELHASEDDDIPEEMIEIEELEFEPYNRSLSYNRGTALCPFTGTSLYTITGFSEEDLEAPDGIFASQFSAVTPIFKGVLETHSNQAESSIKLSSATLTNDREVSNVVIPVESGLEPGKPEEVTAPKDTISNIKSNVSKMPDDEDAMEKSTSLQLGSETNPPEPGYDCDFSTKSQKNTSSLSEVLPIDHELLFMKLLNPVPRLERDSFEDFQHENLILSDCSIRNNSLESEDLPFTPPQLEAAKCDSSGERIEIIEDRSAELLHQPSDTSADNSQASSGMPVESVSPQREGKEDRLAVIDESWEAQGGNLMDDISTDVPCIKSVDACERDLYSIDNSFEFKELSAVLQNHSMGGNWDPNHDEGEVVNFVNSTYSLGNGCIDETVPNIPVLDNDPSLDRILSGFNDVAVSEECLLNGNSNDHPQTDEPVLNSHSFYTENYIDNENFSTRGDTINEIDFYVACNGDTTTNTLSTDDKNENVLPDFNDSDVPSLIELVEFHPSDIQDGPNAPLHQTSESEGNQKPRGLSEDNDAIGNGVARHPKEQPEDKSEICNDEDNITMHYELMGISIPDACSGGQQSCKDLVTAGNEVSHINGQSLFEDGSSAEKSPSDFDEVIVSTETISNDFEGISELKKGSTKVFAVETENDVSSSDNSGNPAAVNDYSCVFSPHGECTDQQIDGEICGKRDSLRVDPSTGPHAGASVVDTVGKLKYDSPTGRDKLGSTALSVPSIVVTEADDVSSSDDELEKFLIEHLKLYKSGDYEAKETFDVTPDFSEKPFEGVLGYETGQSTVLNTFVEASDFICNKDGGMD